MSVEEANKRAKRTYFDAYRAKDLSIFDRLFHPDYVIRVAGFGSVPRDQLKELVASSFETLSEIELDLDDMLAQGDRVATRYTFRARHTGEFLGVAASGRKVSWSGIVIDRFVDGRIVEAWEILDRYGLMQQLGALKNEE